MSSDNLGIRLKSPLQLYFRTKVKVGKNDVRRRYLKTHTGLGPLSNGPIEFKHNARN